VLTMGRWVITAIALGLVLGASTAWADVSGDVRELGTLTPLEDALVTLQATATLTTTDPNGSYTLSVSGSNLVIVAAKKGYYNASVLVNAPASGVGILLEPVPQDNDPNYSLVPPDGCAGCHTDQFNQWNGSAMASAGLNTWVHDIFSGNGTAGGMGGFVYVNDSIFATSNPNSECASCHQPELWIDSPFSAMEDPDQLGYPSDAVLHGVSCDVCHKVADVDVSKINFPGIFPGAVTLTRPQGPAHDQVQYGLLGDTDYTVTSLMRPSYQPQLAAEVCAACHQDKNDPNEDHTYTGVISEPTYLEWLASPFGDLESPFYADCVDCHMPVTGDSAFCSVLFPALDRSGQIRSHDIRGTTAEFLENAVELSITAQSVGSLVEVQVDIENTSTGHHVPTGVTVRNMILLVEAWREEDDLDLVYAGAQTVHDLGGIGDPNQGYYAGLPGKFYAKVNHDPNGQGPTFFTDAFGIQFDNRIPALATDTTFYSFAVPSGGGTLKVEARLVYRRAFRFLVDAKGWTQDGHGNPLEDVLPPHYGHLMEIRQVIVGEAIPTLPPWGSAALMLLLLGAGGLVLRASLSLKDSSRT